MIKKLFLAIGFILAISTTKAQEIDPLNYDGTQLIQAIINGINDSRWRSGLDSVYEKSELSTAATNLSEGYGSMGKVVLIPEDASATAKKAGATIKVQEVAVDVSAGKGKSYLTYSEAAADAVEKLIKQKKFESIIKNPKHIYIGVGSYFVEDKKKIYISVVMGGIDAFNTGAKDRKLVPLRFTKSKRGLDPFDQKECKSCDKFSDLQSLYDGLKVEGNKVYLEYNDWKKFKKYFKNEGDGLAVEFVQRKQYPCGGENIFDYNLNSKGYLFKPSLQAKLFARNENIKNDPKNNTYKGYIAKMPKKVVKKLDENYEMNLYFILNHTVCKVMTHQYLENNGEEGIAPLAFYPDSITSSDPSRYVPKPENQTLTFKVPFEQGKSNYDVKDIKPFLDALKEPQFIINEINIQANSSLEGDSLTNAKLQRNRAQSIIDALEKIQNKKVAGKIETSDSWDMFQDQIKGKAEYKDYVGLSKDAAREKLQNGGAAILEPILKEERFAYIEMKVTYDFTGANEEAFVVNSLRKSIAKKDVENAKRISRFIVQQIVKGRYKKEGFLGLEIPQEGAYASIIVNQMFIDNKYNHADSIYKDLQDKMNMMAQKYPDNDFVNWNKIMFDTKTEGIADVKDINPTQNKINALYSGRIPQRLNDALNLEYQFKIIDKVDTLDASQPNDALKASMDRIKKIFNLEAANWQNSLKLAGIFQSHGDLLFAKKLLEPFLTDDNPDENLLFTYLAIAAHYPDEIYGRNFRMAMQKAKEKNQARYCKLFGAPQLSFQVLDNPAVKKLFCESCQ